MFELLQVVRRQLLVAPHTFCYAVVLRYAADRLIDVYGGVLQGLWCALDEPVPFGCLDL